MKKLIDNLLLFDRLTTQQLRLIGELTQKVTLRPGDHFLRPGNICIGLTFVDEGMLRYNYYNRKAENITSGLVGEGHFISAATPVHLAPVHSDYLQAIMACTLSVIDKKGMERLSSTIMNWENMVKRIAQKATAEKRSRVFRYPAGKDPEHEAKLYLEKFPDLAKYLSVEAMLRYIGSPVNKEA